MIRRKAPFRGRRLYHGRNDPMFTHITARGMSRIAAEVFYEKFGVTPDDAVFTDSTFENVAGITGVGRIAPVMRELMKNPAVAVYINEKTKDGSLLLDAANMPP